MPAMPHIIANKYDVFRALRSKQGLRVIVVLIFVVAIGMLLLKFPGPLFKKAAKIPHFSPEWTQASPIETDGQSVQLGERAAAALADLKAKSLRSDR